MGEEADSKGCSSGRGWPADSMDALGGDDVPGFADPRRTLNVRDPRGVIKGPKKRQRYDNEFLGRRQHEHGSRCDEDKAVGPPRPASSIGFKLVTQQTLSRKPCWPDHREQDASEGDGQLAQRDEGRQLRRGMVSFTD